MHEMKARNGTTDRGTVERNVRGVMGLITRNGIVGQTNSGIERTVDVINCQIGLLDSGMMEWNMNGGWNELLDRNIGLGNGGMEHEKKTEGKKKT